MQMMFLDPDGIRPAALRLQLCAPRVSGHGAHLGLRRASQGDVNGMGRFYGRIWIEDQGGNVVRFNGTYTGPTI